MARTRSYRQRQATALTRSTVDQMLGACADGLIDRRNAALLAVAYDTLARRSELVAFDLDHLSFADDSSGTLLIARARQIHRAGAWCYISLPTRSEWLGDG